MAFGRTFILKASALKPVEKLVRKSFLFRPVVRRFIAGDTLAEAMQVAEGLAARGLGVSLDYLGENTKTREEAVHACEMYREIISAIAGSKHRDRINISIKLTQCGLDIDPTWAEENYREVLKLGEKSDTFVRVDMEASEYTERTIAMVSRVFADHKNTGTVLQSYLKRSIDDTKFMIDEGIRIRVVKGAYLEPESVAFPEKSTVDAKYVEMAKMLLEKGNYPAIATHDESIINAVKEFASANNIGKERFEFQMLYGIRRDLQDGLLAEGYNVRVYVPYGDMWYPYFSRRLAERPANMWFIAKAMFKK
ncbi:MAG: proline dehydrogenase family protein [Armatimonadetes bacterium]|nr:proline dehydrogenase family protein [Armatimonadota bacterium]